MWDEGHERESFEGVPRDFLCGQQCVVPRVQEDSQVRGPKKLFLQVQVQGNQEVHIFCDLLASWSVMIQGLDLSDEKQQTDLMVVCMDHVVCSIQSD